MTGDFQSKLCGGEFVITAEISPPLSSDPEHLLQRAMPLAGLADAVNITDGASAHVHMGARWSPRALLFATSSSRSSSSPAGTAIALRYRAIYWVRRRWGFAGSVWVVVSGARRSVESTPLCKMLDRRREKSQDLIQANAPLSIAAGPTVPITFVIEVSHRSRV